VVIVVVAEVEAMGAVAEVVATATTGNYYRPVTSELGSATFSSAVPVHPGPRFF